MKIVAFLQCQWAKDPEGMKAVYARHANNPERRARLNAAFLFFGCLTGRRLKAALGESVCDEIVWEETSKDIAGKSSGVFPPDPDHIRSVLEHFKPDVVITFGKVAAESVPPLLPDGALHLSGPHPAARHATVVQELRSIAEQIKEAESCHASC